MACMSFSHYAEAPLVVVVLQEDPLDHFEFDFLVVLVPLVYLPVVLLLVPLVCLEDCLFAPDFKRNLVSISCLVEHGLIVQFNSSVSIRSKSSFICSGDLMNNLYFLSPLSYDINAIEIVENEPNHLAKKRKVSNETYLWHLRLGHINPNRIHGLVKSGILNSLAFEPIPICESCLEGKMTKRPFKAKGYCTT